MSKIKLNEEFKAELVLPSNIYLWGWVGLLDKEKDNENGFNKNDWNSLKVGNDVGLNEENMRTNWNSSTRTLQLSISNIISAISFDNYFTNRKKELLNEKGLTEKDLESNPEMLKEITGILSSEIKDTTFIDYIVVYYGYERDKIKPAFYIELDKGEISLTGITLFNLVFPETFTIGKKKEKLNFKAEFVNFEKTVVSDFDFVESCGEKVSNLFCLGDDEEGSLVSKDSYFRLLRKRSAEKGTLEGNCLDENGRYQNSKYTYRTYYGTLKPLILGIDPKLSDNLIRYQLNDEGGYVQVHGTINYKEWEVGKDGVPKLIRKGITDITGVDGVRIVRDDDESQSSFKCTIDNVWDRIVYQASKAEIRRFGIFHIELTTADDDGNPVLIESIPFKLLQGTGGSSIELYDINIDGDENGVPVLLFNYQENARRSFKVLVKTDEDIFLENLIIYNEDEKLERYMIGEEGKFNIEVKSLEFKEGAGYLFTINVNTRSENDSQIAFPRYKDNSFDPIPIYFGIKDTVTTFYPTKVFLVQKPTSPSFSVWIDNKEPLKKVGNSDVFCNVQYDNKEDKKKFVVTLDTPGDNLGYWYCTLETNEGVNIELDNKFGTIPVAVVQPGSIDENVWESLSGNNVINIKLPEKVLSAKSDKDFGSVTFYRYVIEQEQIESNNWRKKLSASEKKITLSKKRAEPYIKLFELDKEGNEGNKILDTTEKEKGEISISGIGTTYYKLEANCNVELTFDGLPDFNVNTGDYSGNKFTGLTYICREGMGMGESDTLKKEIEHVKNPDNIFSFFKLEPKNNGNGRNVYKLELSRDSEKLEEILVLQTKYFSTFFDRNFHENINGPFSKLKIIDDIKTSSDIDIIFKSLERPVLEFSETTKGLNGRNYTYTHNILENKRYVTTVFVPSDRLERVYFNSRNSLTFSIPADNSQFKNNRNNIIFNGLDINSTDDYAYQSGLDLSAGATYYGSDNNNTIYFLKTEFDEESGEYIGQYLECKSNTVDVVNPLVTRLLISQRYPSYRTGTDYNYLTCFLPVPKILPQVINYKLYNVGKELPRLMSSDLGSTNNPYPVFDKSVEISSLNINEYEGDIVYSDNYLKTCIQFDELIPKGIFSLYSNYFLEQIIVNFSGEINIVDDKYYRYKINDNDYSNATSLLFSAVEENNYSSFDAHEVSVGTLLFEFIPRFLPRLEDSTNQLNYFRDQDEGGSQLTITKHLYDIVFSDTKLWKSDSETDEKMKPFLKNLLTSKLTLNFIYKKKGIYLCSKLSSSVDLPFSGGSGKYSVEIIPVNPNSKKNNYLLVNGKVTYKDSPENKCRVTVLPAENNSKIIDTTLVGIYSVSVENRAKCISLESAKLTKDIQSVINPIEWSFEGEVTNVDDIPYTTVDHVVESSVFETSQKSVTIKGRQLGRNTAILIGDNLFVGSRNFKHTIEIDGSIEFTELKIRFVKLNEDGTFTDTTPVSPSLSKVKMRNSGGAERSSASFSDNYDTIYIDLPGENGYEKDNEYYFTVTNRTGSIDSEDLDSVEVIVKQRKKEKAPAIPLIVDVNAPNNTIHFLSDGSYVGQSLDDVSGDCILIKSTSKNISVSFGENEAIPLSGKSWWSSYPTFIDNNLYYTVRLTSSRLEELYKKKPNGNWYKYSSDKNKGSIIEGFIHIVNNDSNGFEVTVDYTQGYTNLWADVVDNYEEVDGVKYAIVTDTNRIVKFNYFSESKEYSEEGKLLTKETNEGLAASTYYTNYRRVEDLDSNKVADFDYNLSSNPYEFSVVYNITPEENQILVAKLTDTCVYIHPMFSADPLLHHCIGNNVDYGYSDNWQTANLIRNIYLKYKKK